MSCSSAGSLAWHGLDQASRWSTKRIVVDEIEVPAGSRAVRVVAGLNFPSALTWDAAGRLYVLESHTVAVPLLRTKIVRIDQDGRIRKVNLSGGPPDTGTAIGLTHHDGWLYFSHQQENGNFGIFRVSTNGGAVEPVLLDLPTQGDHDVNKLIFDREGALYFGVGSATNSGVVASNDYVNVNWLGKYPQAADVPCHTIQLTGKTFRDPAGKVTGAFQPLGQSSATSIPGKLPCMTAVFRLPRGASQPELVAWGFRNPVGFAFDDRGRLYVGAQAADERGTRQILDDPDAVYRVEADTWYGWPDFSGALIPVTDSRYRAPEMPADGFVIDHSRSGLSVAPRSLVAGTTKPHAAIGGMTFHQGRLLIAEMGDFRPADKERAGFQVESLNPASGEMANFARNRGTGQALPASMHDLRHALERPVDVQVGPDGLVYILDFGVFDTGGQKPQVMPKSGKVFRVEPANQ